MCGARSEHGSEGLAVDRAGQCITLIAGLLKSDCTTAGGSKTPERELTHIVRGARLLEPSVCAYFESHRAVRNHVVSFPNDCPLNGPHSTCSKCKGEKY